MPHTAAHILTLRHGFEMVRINAISDAAKVIPNQSAGRFSRTKAMGTHCPSIAIPKRAVPLSVFGSRPYPASLGFLHLIPEPDICGGWFRACAVAPAAPFPPSNCLEMVWIYAVFHSACVVPHHPGRGFTGKELVCRDGVLSAYYPKHAVSGRTYRTCP